MAIECYVGKIGGGKTYFAVQTICAQLAKGGMVATNIVLKWDSVADYIAEIYGVIPQREQYFFLSELDEENPDGGKRHMIEDLHKYIPLGTTVTNVLVVIDEAHLWFDASLTIENRKRFKGLREFLSQSRKVIINMVFIAQAWETMDMFIRRQTSVVWTTRDMRTFRIMGLHRILGHTFARTGYDYTLKFEMYPRKFHTRDNRIFGLYDSFALLKPFETSGEYAQEFKLEKKKKGKKKMLKYVLIFALVAAVVMGISTWRGVKGFFDGGKKTKEEDVVQVPEKAALEEKASVQADIIREHVTTIMEPQLVITRESGILEVGHPCPHGWVEAVATGGRVRIKGFDGLVRFLIPAPVEVPSVQSAVAQQPVAAAEPVIAKVEPYKLVTPLDNHGRKK